ncbi:MAG TPA: sugar transferase [Desulfosporosinus sp.]|nr:sugar transferase [Desulfosporosinus sp.]
MDFILSLIAIIVLSPVLLITALLVRTKLGSPVIFKQKRPGLNEGIFTLHKFRTMTDSKDEDGELLPDSVRLTKFGRILRSTSLDELPELWNILKGDMSIVGPRPLLVRYLPYYRENERLRSAVRPGITGLAQVQGRNTLTWNERFQTDIDYVNNLSFRHDLAILMHTVLVVVKKENILVGTEHVLKDLDVDRKDEINGNKISLRA